MIGGGFGEAVDQLPQDTVAGIERVEILQSGSSEGPQLCDAPYNVCSGTIASPGDMGVSHQDLY